MTRRTAIVGGGAAGFFAAICLKEMQPEREVCIFEAAQKVLRKVEVSGGGRCNCTNTFRDVTDLSQVYPRGHRLLKRLFKGFGPQDAYQWFERHGVALTVQDDQCVFPRSQDSHTVINLFLAEASRHGITVRTGQKICSLSSLAYYDTVVVTTGGSPRAEGLAWLEHPTEKPIPSLFTLNIEDKNLRQLMGTVVEQATAFLPGTKLKSAGPLLITHWGMSGPCILRLSSYAARLLADHDYRLPLSVNWTGATEDAVRRELERLQATQAQRRLTTLHPFGIPGRLWDYLLAKSVGTKADGRWSELSRKELNRLTNQLVNDTYQTAGRAPFKDEFVTCGGISLKAVDAATLESKLRPGLYFAGEVLDIDGVTGGFNFQAAWTTAHTVARAIAQRP